MHLISFGEMPDEMKCCHKCDTPRCVNPAHLFIGSHKENMDDMSRKGRKAILFGEDSGMAKFTTEIVISIREMRRNGAKVIDLARNFGMSKAQASKIANGTSWSHVKTAH